MVGSISLRVAFHVRERTGVARFPNNSLMDCIKLGHRTRGRPGRPTAARREIP